MALAYPVPGHKSRPQIAICNLDRGRLSEARKIVKPAEVEAGAALVMIASQSARRTAGSEPFDAIATSVSSNFRRPQASPALFQHLCEPLRRLQWLRQELDLWNEAEAARLMPQPRDCGLNLPNLRPSDVHWITAIWWGRP